jgi:hypothetical protein
MNVCQIPLGLTKESLRRGADDMENLIAMPRYAVATLVLSQMPALLRELQKTEFAITPEVVAAYLTYTGSSSVIMQQDVNFGIANDSAVIQAVFNVNIRNLVEEMIDITFSPVYIDTDSITGTPDLLSLGRRFMLTPELLTDITTLAGSKHPGTGIDRVQIKLDAAQQALQQMLSGKDGSRWSIFFAHQRLLDRTLESAASKQCANTLKSMFTRQPKLVLRLLALLYNQPSDTDISYGNRVKTLEAIQFEYPGWQPRWMWRVPTRTELLFVDRLALWTDVTTRRYIRTTDPAIYEVLKLLVALDIHRLYDLLNSLNRDIEQVGDAAQPSLRTR